MFDFDNVTLKKSADIPETVIEKLNLLSAARSLSNAARNAARTGRRVGAQAVRRARRGAHVVGENVKLRASRAAAHDGIRAVDSSRRAADITANGRYAEHFVRASRQRADRLARLQNRTGRSSSRDRLDRRAASIGGAGGGREWVKGYYRDGRWVAGFYRAG